MRVALLSFLLLVGCGFPLTPTPSPDKSPIKGDAEVTCDKLRELECPDTEDTPEGNTCEDVLRNAAENGIDLIGDVNCVQAATTCKGVEACAD